MSGSALMAPQVNLDEFERRLRAAGSPVGPQEDPLDELARLVGMDVRESKPTRSKPPQRTFGFAPKAEAPRLPAVHLLHVDESSHEASAHDHLSPTEEAPTMEEASLRGSLEDDALVQDFGPQDEMAHPDAVYHEAMAPADEAAPRRSGRMALTLGSLVAIGAAGLVGAWVVKGAPGLPKTPPIIMAVDGPTKVQPPTQDTIASPSDSASVLLKDQSGKPGPVNLVSNVEQPVDLQQTKPQPAPAAPSAAAPAAPSPAPAIPVIASSSATVPAASAPAASAPPVPLAPPSLSPTRSIALTSVGSTAAPPAAPAPFPEPKRVKTVSVRPDGSVISSGNEVIASAGASATAPSAPSAAAPADAAASPAFPDAAPQPANPPVPRARPQFDASTSGAAQPATPKLDLPTKLSPKSTARVPIAKTDTTVATGPAQSPQAPPQPVPNLLQKFANAVTGQPDTQVAAADPAATATTPAAGGGVYSVQLAAPGTEQEAQSASTRLQAKYASALGGMQPAIHPAEVNGRQIYRVRLSSLSKADAVALCLRLKAVGGDAACFVAKN
ncbi:SPOR domain-containing protein [Methylocapsa sp. S129]|uniref:SPOR domain-containing protein n=1 Tax=Methylocapsa sp. S129 TaxID=1641869 RepID=UPI00131D742B|nr:SPOR domain-containing protein [Methylocapsa sp. S129]